MAGYVLKITIENSHPPVWRRVAVPTDITFKDLHDIIQILFGWEGYHLHDFQYPAEYFQVVDCEDEWGMGELHLEAETAIDPYIGRFPWIRYTYDFGDDWKHKIVLEKVLEDFSERHAVLLKLKGDHFEEDCGGMFGDETSCRIPADEIEIGARLAEMNLPVFQPEQKAVSGEDKQLLESEDLMFSLFTEVFSDVLGSCSEKEKEQLYRAVCDAPDLNFGMQKHESIASRRLSDWDADTEEILESGGEISLVFQKSPDNMAAFLTDWHQANLKDYCNYLGISVRRNASKKTMAAAVSDMVTAHPEFVQMLFAEPELYILKDYLDAMEKNKPCGYEDDTACETIEKAVSLGLFRIETLGKQRLIHVANDAAKLVEAVYAGDWKRYYEWMEEIEHACCLTLIIYGVVDINFLKTCCERIVGRSLKQDEFRRMVYWHGRMNEIFVTGKHIDNGEELIMLPGLDLSGVKNVEQCCGAELDFRIFSDEELKIWEKGFFEAIPEWAEYEELLKMLEDPEPEEMFLYLTEDYIDLLGGTSVTEFLEDLYDTYSEELTVDIAVGLWETVMAIVMKMPLAGLKGHSRESYSALTGAPLDAISLFDTERLDRRVTKMTMLHRFPADVQLALYEAYASSKKDAYINCLDCYLKKYKNNEALLVARALAESERILEENPGMTEELNEIFSSI